MGQVPRGPAGPGPPWGLCACFKAQRSTVRWHWRSCKCEHRQMSDHSTSWTFHVATKHSKILILVFFGSRDAESTIRRAYTPPSDSTHACEDSRSQQNSSSDRTPTRHRGRFKVKGESTIYSDYFRGCLISPVKRMYKMYQSSLNLKEQLPSGTHVSFTNFAFYKTLCSPSTALNKWLLWLT